MADRRKIEIPEEFDDERAFVEFARRLYKEDIEFDNDNRLAMAEDLRFLIGDHWDDEVKSMRDTDGKPCLTINHIPAFVGQLIGNRRLNETVIKVLPDHNGTRDVARIRQGLIRNIEKASRAERAYNSAFQSQVSGGIGNWKVNVEYANDDVFDQDIRISPVLDAEAVVWDRRILDPTGADAGHVFVEDVIDREDFKRLYPDVQPSSFGDESYGEKLSSTAWFTETDVRVTEFWRMLTRTRVLAMMTDGDVEDITDEYVEDENGDEVLPQEIFDRVQKRQNGQPIMREVERPYAEMYLLSGQSVLEGPYRLPISRVPVFRAPGWEVRVGDKVHRWGLIRFMKDPMRFMNFWRSAITEKIMQAPKVRYIGSDTAFEGYEKDWDQAHLTNSMRLTYNGEAAAAPKEVTPVQIEPALIQAAQMSMDDLQHVTNMRDASLGNVSNEVSGKAIIARQRVGELGTVIYLSNLDNAIEETGRVINELIPIVYDTERKLKILGDEDQEDIVSVNGEGGPDITAGKYSVTITTGPSTATKRVEAAEGMLTFLNHAPQAAERVLDLFAEAQDWPKAQEIARRFRATLPPGIVNNDDMSPEQQAAQQAAAQEAEAQKELQNRMQVAQLEKLEAQRDEATARAREAVARANKTESEVGVVAAKTQSEIDKNEAEEELTEAKAINEQMQTKEKPGGRESKDQ